MNRGGSMPVLVLFIISVCCLVGAAFLWNHSENKSFDGFRDEVRGYKAQVEEFEKSKSKASEAMDQIAEIWNQFQKMEEENKALVARCDKLDRQIGLTQQIAHDTRMRIGGKDARGDLPQKVMVEFTPLHVRVDKHIHAPDKSKTPLSDRAGITSGKKKEVSQ